MGMELSIIQTNFSPLRLGDRRPSLLRRVVREHRLFLLVVLLYACAGLLLDLLGIVPGLARKLSYTYAYLLPPALIWIPVLGTLVRERWKVREGGQRVNGWDGWVLGYRRARQGGLSSDRILGLVLVACVVPIFMNTFGGWKAAIPTLHPFEYDHLFFRIDRVLHAGRDPWAILHPILGRPAVTHFLDQTYALWLFFVPAVVVWQAWNRDLQTRRQFLIAFVLIWILLGTVMAVAASSAGPCYYTRVTGLANPYQPLFEYLGHFQESGITLLSQVGQEILWRNYALVDVQPYTRISAMPSLHVAMPVLYTLAGLRTHKLLGLLFGFYTLLIFLGSIHLGWHYAVDGEVSLILVPLIWVLSGRIVSRLGHA